ncbi:hypothetical protein E3N88_29173 [Mikania micrantha]|uniref:Uncharacterized protein n=1 Tax=Mikania micrantha TaxID=192012 RepID=A0A5N6MI44_9ASTR|nr:hypothetical protein E3N88_29173 [Mikania micrantha]
MKVRLTHPLNQVNLCVVIPDQVSHTSSLRHHHYASATFSVTSSQVTRGGAMDNLGERYIYQRFPYVILNDTPSSSSGSDSDPSEASSGASQAVRLVPSTPPSPVPVTPPSPVSVTP